jgi:hypothetical protein
MNPAPQASRPAPTAVAPVEHDGVRYQQDLDSYRHGGDQPGGYLVAIDSKTGERMWMLKVYELNSHPAPGLEHPGLYFKTLRLAPGGGALEIENEGGGRYLVDLASRTATKVPAPRKAKRLPPIQIPQ